MIRATLIGVGITFIGMMIPVAHIVTGPLGPVAGGFFAGQALENPSEAHALGVGVLMGAILGIVAAPFTLAVALLVDDLPAAVWAAPLAVAAWAALLGTFGALLGQCAGGRRAGLR